MRSDEFRERWAAHDVRQYQAGTQAFRHPLVGELTLAYEALDLAADVDQILIAYTAQPGSPSHAGLRRLANWARETTADPVDVPPETAQPGTGGVALDHARSGPARPTSPR